MGVACASAGLAILVWPHETVHIVAIVFGSAVLVASILRYFASFASTERTLDRPFYWAALSTLGLVVGIFLLADWTVSLMALMIVITIYFLAHALIELLQVKRSGLETDRAWVLASGTMALVVGLVLTTSLIAPKETPVPRESLGLLGDLLGSWLILYGLLLILRGALRTAGDHGSS
ncbi:MAG TPA: DUF308 domain-containing protein [Candidatus Dormibacteraeota bacterium]|nr:DUF308 domain-containing protein [Candidatus Dormibacteraeota bacterium]